MNTSRAAKPWYREPWPWLLMAGPALVIVAGIITTVIAVRTSDGVVADDYYKQGLGINRTLARDARAGALHVSAQVQFNEERTAARVRLAGDALPDTIKLTLVHPTRAGGDQSALLQRVSPAGPGQGQAMYQGRIQPPRAGTWRMRIEDAQNTWRLTGMWRTRDGAASLDAAS